MQCSMRREESEMGAELVDDITMSGIQKMISHPTLQNRLLSAPALIKLGPGGQGVEGEREVRMVPWAISRYAENLTKTLLAPYCPQWSPADVRGRGDGDAQRSEEMKNG